MFTDEHDVQRIEKVSLVSKNLSLVKGEAIESFQYNSGMKLTRDGKYVKERLSLYKKDIDEAHATCHAQLAAAKAALPKEVIPTEEPSSYTFDGIRKSAFGEYPKMFSWESKKAYRSQHEAEEKYPAMGSITEAVSIPAVKTTYQLMNDYNDHARRCIALKGDGLWLDTLIASIDDKQQIELTPRMLKVLV